MRTVDVEQVRKTCARHAQMGARTLGPFILERDSLSTAYVYAGQPPGYGIEAGGQDQNVQFVLALLRLDALRGYSLDRRLAQVDKRDIVLIEHLVIILFQRRALDAERMGRIHGRQLVRNGRIFDPCAGFIAPECVSGAIGFFVHQNIVERADPRVKAAFCPEILVDGQPFLRRDLKRRFRHEIEVEPAKHLAATAESGRVVLFHPTRGLLVQLFLPHGQR